MNEYFKNQEEAVASERKRYDRLLAAKDERWRQREINTEFKRQDKEWADAIKQFERDEFKCLKRRVDELERIIAQLPAQGWVPPPTVDWLYRPTTTYSLGMKHG